MRNGVRALGVIVVNYAATTLLEENLARISDSGLDARFVVVDNFSTARERDLVTQACERHGWSLVAPPGNPGFGAGVNLGVADARSAGCEYYLLLNPDAWVDAEAVRAMTAQVRDDPEAVICPRIETTDGTVVYKGSQVSKRSGRIKGFGPYADAAGPVLRLDGDVSAQLPGPTQGWLTGACLMVHRDLFERIGGFDESYFLYWEDIDLSQRFLELGGELAVLDELVAVHSVGGTQRSGGTERTEGKSAVYCYHNCRNRLRFAEGHLAPRERLRWLRFTPGYAVRTMSLSGRRHALHHPSIVWASLRGSVAGSVAVLRSVVADRGGGHGVSRPSR